MTIARCLAEWDYMARNGYFYDNGPSRCAPFPYKGRDCSTFAAAGLNAGFPGSIDACSNSFGQAAWCYDTPRPDWFSKRFGPGHGTFITRDQARFVVCLGFHGTDFGMRPDYSGDGHVEIVLGQGTRTVGAHSHATGVGYDNSGFTFNFCEYFAVPPCFLAEMTPPNIDPATLEALRKLVEWEGRVSKMPLHRTETNGDVTILNDLLIHKNLLDPHRKSNTYTRYTAAAVAHFKTARQLTNRDGSVFGADAAHAMLHPH